MLRIHKSIYDSHYSIDKSRPNPFTHQPVQGKKRLGGIKFGEMEFTAAAASGSTKMIKELHTKSSDAFPVYICSCGSTATIVNKQLNRYSCLSCNNPSIIELSSSYTTNLVTNILQSMDIKLEFNN